MLKPKQSSKNKSCPKFESDEWNHLNKSEKNDCNKRRLSENTSKYLFSNVFITIIISMIGGLVFALVFIMIEPIQTEFGQFQVYWFALILFGIVLLLSIIQFYLEKRKDYYQRQIQ